VTPALILLNSKQRLYSAILRLSFEGMTILTHYYLQVNNQRLLLNDIYLLGLNHLLALLLSTLKKLPLLLPKKLLNKSLYNGPSWRQLYRTIIFHPVIVK